MFDDLTFHHDLREQMCSAYLDAATGTGRPERL